MITVLLDALMIGSGYKVVGLPIIFIRNQLTDRIFSD
jgi:hypothetical protein